MDAHPACFRTIQPQVLLVASYDTGPDVAVPLVSPCDVYFDNGSFQAVPDERVLELLGVADLFAA